MNFRGRKSSHSSINPHNFEWVWNNFDFADGSSLSCKFTKLTNRELLSLKVISVWATLLIIDVCPLLLKYCRNCTDLNVKTKEITIKCMIWYRYVLHSKYHTVFCECALCHSPCEVVPHAEQFIWVCCDWYYVSGVVQIWGLSLFSFPRLTRST